MNILISSLLLVTYCITFITSGNGNVGKYHIDFSVESNSYTRNDDSSCPTWFYCNTRTSRCQCGESYNGMKACDEATGRAAVSDCHCVTYDDGTQVGPCYYNCKKTAHKTLYDRIYHPLPKNPTKLTGRICGRFNRMGTLCGQCAHLRPQTCGALVCCCGRCTTPTSCLMLSSTVSRFSPRFSLVIVSPSLQTTHPLWLES